MKRSAIESVKQRIKLLSEAIAEMEILAGWVNSVKPQNHPFKPHPEDIFYAGKYTGAVKRESMGLTRALADLRR